MKPAVGYLRISKDTDGLSASPERQRKEIEVAAKAKGFEVIRWYEDRDKSAYHRYAKRPAFTKMLQELDDVDAIFVWALDRASRNWSVAANLLETLDDAGVRLISVSDNEDSGGPSRVHMEIRFSLAAEESRRTSARIKTAQQHKIDNGVIPAPKRMFGWDYDSATRKLTVNPDEATIIRKMVGAFLDGMSLRRIGMGLNDGTLMGFVVTTPRGNAWADHVVSKLIGHPKLAGWFTRYSMIVGDEPWIDPILTQEEYEEVQARLKVMRSGQTRRRPSPRRTWLYGIAKCGYCGGPLTVNGSETTFWSYRCSRNTTCKHFPSMKTTRLEGFVERWILNHDIDPNTVSLEERESVESKELRQNVLRLETAIERLMDAFALGEGISRDAFGVRLKDYESRLTIARDKQASLQTSSVLRLNIPDLETVWPLATMEERASIAEALIERVAIWRQDDLDHPTRFEIVPRL